MSDIADAPANAGLFLRRWLANPLQMGSIVPSSPTLCRIVAQHAMCGGEDLVVELGAGTGVISRALLDAGLPARRLVVVEIVPEMVAHLRRVLPGARVVQGDARELPRLLRNVPGRVGAAICGVPLVLLPLAEQRRFTEAFATAAPGCGFLHYSYCVTSPIPRRRLGLSGRRLAWTPWNFPPASLWHYRPAAG